MKKCSLVVLLIAGLCGVSQPAQALDPLLLYVSPAVSTAPANVRVRARVERDTDNRAIEIAADSEEFYRSSFIALEGDKAPVVTEIAFKGLPGGEYQVTVILHGARGIRATAKRRVTILESLVDSKD
jgi:hypothetical protein